MAYDARRGAFADGPTWNGSEGSAGNELEDAAEEIVRRLCGVVLDEDQCRLFKGEPRQQLLDVWRASTSSENMPRAIDPGGENVVDSEQWNGELRVTIRLKYLRFEPPTDGSKRPRIYSVVTGEELRWPIATP
jgi:hypothetical protein